MELLQSTDDGGNILLSPVSILSALAMTANGAAGETKSQMEDVLGLPVSDLNAYFQSYTDALPAGKDARCSLANSIWFRDDADQLTVEQSFLDVCADYYGADLFRAPPTRRFHPEGPQHLGVRPHRRDDPLYSV